MHECWKPVLGYEDRFLISTYGRLKNLNGNILKLHKNKRGYITYASKIGGRKGINKCFKIHRLVAEAFLDNICNYPFVNHIDGIKDNNRLDNLEWCTAKQNSKHAKDNDLANTSHLQPYNIKSRKISNEDVNFIRLNYIPYHREYGQTKLSIKYSVNKSVIREIIEGTIYKDVV